MAAPIAQCRIVFPLSDICANSGADAHVRGRPPGRPLLAPKHPHPQKERDEGVPRRPGGLPHLISAGISPLGKLCGISPNCPPPNQAVGVLVVGGVDHSLRRCLRRIAADAIILPRPSAPRNRANLFHSQLSATDRPFIPNLLPPPAPPHRSARCYSNVYAENHQTCLQRASGRRGALWARQRTKLHRPPNPRGQNAFFPEFP
jgi:hypothetical protein